MSKELYLIQYERKADGTGSLIVADPNKRLENGNYKILTIIIGNYADILYRDLTGSDKDKGSGTWIREKLDKYHYKFSCNKCGFTERFRDPAFCGGCGRKMKKYENEV